MLSIKPIGKSVRVLQRAFWLFGCFASLLFWAQPFGSAARQTQPAASVYLSDLTPSYQTNGRGPVERDRSNGGAQVLDGRALAIKGAAYRKGLGVAPYAEVRYELGGRFAMFRAEIGMADEAGANSAVVFRVLADGVKVFESETLKRGTAAQPVSINVAGKKSLTLVVRETDPDDEQASAIWADARLEIASGEVAPPANGAASSPASDAVLPTHTHAPGTVVDEDHIRTDLELAARARNNPAFVLPRDIKYATAPDQLQQLGLWSGAVTWPIVVASVATLPDGRLLAWGGHTARTFGNGQRTLAYYWDPVTNQFTAVNNEEHGMFCAIPTLLEDGRVFVNGGDGSRERVSIFDWRTNLWTRAEDMNRSRWYPGSVALPNGQVFTALGEPGDVYPEIWTAGQGWTLLNGANLQAPILNFPGYQNNWLPYFYLAPNGNIFHAGPTQQMNWINPTGSGSVANAGLNNTWYPKYAGAVMFDKGKILVTGGQISGSNLAASSQAHVLDVNGATATRTQVASMTFARKFHNAVVLPNGEVMVVGGNTSGVEFDDAGSQLTPEIWNPDTNTWRSVADISVPRNYHSLAVLMTDGRVWSGGGGLCACPADHPDHQIFTPPYLYTANGTLAARPSITAAPAQVVAGQTITVQATAGLTKFSFIKMTGLTHDLNSDLRYLSLPFTAPSSGQYQLTLDSNRNVLTPGYWMLFALNSAGVPSVAKVIQVVTALRPEVVTPVVQDSTLNTAATLQISAHSLTGATLSYSATGLPPGLGINAQTGLISGTPTQTGTFHVTVTVSDAASAQATFDWFVHRPNLALVKPATQSSDNDPFSTAARALDGDTNGNYSYGSVASTKADANAWWQVDLGANYALDGVQLWNRTDCCMGNLSNYYVFVSTANQTGRSLAAILNDPTVFRSLQTAIAPTSLNIPASATGRYVRVQLAGTNNLNLAEVRVFGALPQTNRPPVLGTLSNRVSSVGNTVNATLSATDPDGDTLSFSATGLPPGVTLSNTGALAGTTTTAGNYTVNVTVNDGRGGTATGSFAWTVNAQLALNPITATPKPANTNITYAATAINGINPRFKWLFGDGTAETAYSTSNTVTKSFAQPGLYSVRCTATDDRGLEVNTMFVQAVHLPATATRPAVSMNIVIEDRAAANDRLWVVNQDNDSVSVFDAVTNAKAAEITVGAAPRSLAIAPNGRVWVTNKRAATISIIDPAALTVAQTVNLPYASQPFGIAFGGGAAWVALEAAGKLLKLDAVSGAVTGTVNTGPNVRHLSITGDGSRVYLSRFITPPVPNEATVAPQVANGGGEVLVINTATLAVAQTIRLQHSNDSDTENSGRGLPNYLGPAVLSPDGVNAWTPSKKDNVLRGTLRDGRNLTFESTVRSITSHINLTTNAEDLPGRLDHNNGGIASTGLFDRTGNYLFVALEGSREVAVVDAYAKREIIRLSVGRAPQGLALSADGQRVFVSNFMDRTVSVLDLTTLLNGGAQSVPVVATLNAVASERLTAQVLNGKRLFYDARDTRLARDAYLSCASCHNDGGHDGRVWDLTGFGEGVRNTIALQGRAATGHGFVHWSANFDEVQDFEGQIRNLAGGTGLMSDAQFNTGTRNQPLGDRKTGVSADLDALAAYVASLSAFSQSPNRTNGALTADATAGKQIFQAANCAQCHSGTAFTEALNGTLRNVGTLKPASGTRLGQPLTGIDTPTLRDVWATAPYLHDGSAATLEAAVTAHNNVSISATDLPKLVAYLQQIGSEEPSAPNPNQLPTVSLTAPANNATFTAPATINLAANAADGDGSILRVEFYQGTTKLGEDTTAPYTFDWANVAANTYTLTARAFDNLGASANSTAITITVNPPANQPPTVSLTAPANNATFTAPATINLAANAADSDGTVARVEFYQGTTKLGEDTTAPYTFAWTNVAANAYSLTARAFDNSGASTNSTAVNITVNPPANQPPTVSLTAPTNNATFTAPATINLAANAADNGGSIARVEFYQGTTKLGEDTTAPYTFAWTNVAANTYSLTARAFDNSGASANSTAVNITVNPPANQLPTVSLTAPTNNATFTAPATINLAANAADNGGSIARVEFYQGTTKLGEDTTAPYTFTWTNVAAGPYTLTARAFDNVGASTTSAAVNVTVTNPGGGGVQNVIWANLVNTTVAGTVLRKSAGRDDGTQDGSANSQQTIASGDGYVEFTATGPNVYRAVSLDGGSLGTFETLDFAVVFIDTNIAEFRQAGVYRGDTFFNVNDVFRIAVESGTVNFYRNGVKLASGSRTPSYPLKVAAVFSALNGEISNAKISGGGGGGGSCTYSVNPLSVNLPAAGGSANLSVSAPAGCAWTATDNASWLTVTAGASGSGNGTATITASANTGAQRSAVVTIAGQTVAVTQAAATGTGNTAVVWTNLVNTSVLGNILRKTGGSSDGSWDGGAVSQQTINSGTGWFEFTASGPLAYRAIGLNAVGSLSDETSVDFAVVFVNGNYVEFRESGVYLGDAAYVNGDVFRVAIEGNRVAFYKNGVRLVQSTRAPAYPIRAAAVFAPVGGEITAARMATGNFALDDPEITPSYGRVRGKN